MMKTTKIWCIGGRGLNSLVHLRDNFPTAEYCVVGSVQENLENLDTTTLLLEKSEVKQKTMFGGFFNALYKSEPKSKPIVLVEHHFAEIIEKLQGCKKLILVAGLGGDTGSVATPAIAKLAKQQGCTVIAAVTTPFIYEGETRTKVAQQALQELKDYTDECIVVDNQEMLILPKNISMQDAFAEMDNITVVKLKEHI
ncbi:hypothetical protein [Haemophilus paraphrohaemolyticus]